MKRRAIEFLPSNSVETIYETTPRKAKIKFEIEYDDDDDDDDDNDYNDAVTEDNKDYGSKNFAEIGSPYLTVSLQ